MKEFLHFKNVKDYHQFANLPSSEHPMISLVDYSQIQYPSNIEELKWTQGYYTIGLKRNVAYKFFYGQQDYDFDEGLMTFIAPGQVMSLKNNPNLHKKPSGWLLLVHADFLWNTPLASKIKNYDFFGYNVNEALFLSEKEEMLMIEILKNIEQEYQNNIDSFSQKIIIAQLELLLNYANRFYQRQFLTRTKSNHGVVNQVETFLSHRFQEKLVEEKGLPTVKEVAEAVHLSPNYLSSILKATTGKSTQQLIHKQLIVLAKEKLSTSSLSISQVAYALGFEHPASFTKLFKNKTEMSPAEFRSRFN